MRCSRLKWSDHSATLQFIAVVLCVIAVVSAPATAADREQKNRQDFDIPAQSLDAALVLFAAQSGVQVLYDSHLATTLKSSEVRGSFSTADALNRLLKGTELIPRFTNDRAITLAKENDDDAIALDTLRVETQLTIGGNRSWDAYARVLQTAVSAALRSEGMGHERFRLSMRLWIDAAGKVARVELNDSTGDRQLDREIPGKLHGLSLPQPPPAGMPQPVRIRVNAQAVSETP